MTEMMMDIIANRIADKVQALFHDGMTSRERIYHLVMQVLRARVFADDTETPDTTLTGTRSRIPATVWAMDRLRTIAETGEPLDQISACEAIVRAECVMDEASR